MNDIIIHISDLHISDQSRTFGYANSDTYLTCNPSTQNLSFINQFLDKIKAYTCRNKYLVITGDITNIAEQIEFEEGERIISHILTELEIDSDRLLLIPGDHDAHRDSIKEELRKDNATDSLEFLNKIKFKNFNNFYKKFKKIDFEFDKIIFDTITIGNIVLLALNSNYKVNQNGGHGYIPIDILEEELKEIKKTFPYEELILCFHHNLEGEHEDSHFGQWEKENKKDLIALFERFNIKCILNGNEHTHNSKNLANREGIIISDSGVFSSKNSIDASFKIYEIIDSNNCLSLLNNIYVLHKVNGNTESNFGNWIKINSEEIKGLEKNSFEFRKLENLISVNPIDQLPENDEIETTVSNLVYQKSTALVKYENKDIQNKLYNIIKEKKLFHQGHFHWSETSRAHNWIDTAKLLENKEDLYFIKNSIIDVLEKMNLVKNTDLIIGLGYEGNIISSKTSIKYSIPYTYLPYSYRWEDHNDFENKLNFDNSKGKYRQVLLITDVVNDGRTIRKLVGKETREKKFFERVEKIIVVSLFYTGHKDVNINILNFDNLEEKDKIGDEIVNNIEFYTIKQLRIEKCPYGDDYKEKCFIMYDNLHCVHKFYSEKL
ncbi:metallophosphoesterase [Cloacibacterium normanense]|uniref:Calcineurin-like phosphoesterase domain-containing protein n=1 Tax=Cloacibacterium normanense TaxID=237258 RepID=A0A1E5UDU7_9FLAO|nr:metallophosphoesterase [Cloacibacterium normanense]AZI69768.1 hypothetical protein EB819_07700 [Cloacibacterium normanense]OEL11094.1 hypothetical protein BHF72_2448 [Cloacibacterium normanense]SDO87601.1 3',5'-cyclic AMP phosphodiesterase CpdA [Cloacibacterium normanense]